MHSMATPKADETYTYEGDEPIGAGNSALTPGTSVTVREVVKADTSGAHDDSEDAVVVLWDAPTIIKTDKGNEIGYAERALSVGLDAFGTTFTKES